MVHFSMKSNLIYSLLQMGADLWDKGGTCIFTVREREQRKKEMEWGKDEVSTPPPTDEPQEGRTRDLDPDLIS